MDNFKMYFAIGFNHISDPKGYDHLLFVATLCAFYSYTDWKKILILVTAFTAGHSITLALSALNIFIFSSKLVEILIPITILLTAIYNIWFYPQRNKQVKLPLNYIMALFFGLVHGLGFSTFFKAMMGGAKGILLPLFSFNLGIEIGQILIVLSLMLILYLLTIFFKIIHRDWTLFISGAGFGLALVMIFERLYIFK